MKSMQQSLKMITASIMMAATISSFALGATSNAKANPTSHVKPATSSDVSEKAKKSLTHNFPDAESINWVESANGQMYTAYFKLFDVKTVASFDKDGQVVNILRYYKEDRLPLDVLTLLKTRYSGKTVAGVTEFSKPDADDIAYYIKLEDKAHWYTVRIVGTDMTETERLDKQL
jgi:hypothetical protein